MSHLSMSGAVDLAEVMLMGVSLAYKESANCRLEAQYGHLQGIDILPLMMQRDCAYGLFPYNP